MKKNRQGDCPSAPGELVFYIRVQFRRNSSMQGTVHWIDGKKSAIFRSVLELGLLMNDAVARSTGTGERQVSPGQWVSKEHVS